MARNLNSSPLSKSILQHAGAKLATVRQRRWPGCGFPPGLLWIGRCRAGVFSRLIRRRSVRRFTTPGSGPRCALAATGSGKLPVSRPEGRSGARHVADDASSARLAPALSSISSCNRRRPQSAATVADLAGRRGRKARNRDRREFGEPLQITIAHADLPEMIMGLEDIFHIAAELALAGPDVLEHRIAVKSPGILVVEAVGDTGHSEDALSTFECNGTSVRDRPKSPVRVP